MMKPASKAETAKAEDNFDALFDYSNTLPPCDDSSEEDDELELIKVVPKSKSVGVGLSSTDLKPALGCEKVVPVETSTAKNDDDWLAPLPQLTGRQEMSDPTLDSIKRQKQALQEILLSSTKSLQSCEVAAKLAAVENESADAEQPLKKRQKVLLMMQRKTGEPHGYRIFADDPLEKLFTRYAQNFQSDSPSGFTFRFDGDKLDPQSKPDDLGMENEDIIEVHESTR